jgi:hypothetical protein
MFAKSMAFINDPTVRGGAAEGNLDIESTQQSR